MSTTEAKTKKQNYYLTKIQSLVMLFLLYSLTYLNVLNYLLQIRWLSAKIVFSLAGVVKCTHLTASLFAQATTTTILHVGEYQRGIDVRDQQRCCAEESVSGEMSECASETEKALTISRRSWQLQTYPCNVSETHLPWHCKSNTRWTIRHTITQKGKHSHEKSSSPFRETNNRQCLWERQCTRVHQSQ